VIIVETNGFIRPDLTETLAQARLRRSSLPVLAPVPVAPPPRPPFLSLRFCYLISPTQSASALNLQQSLSLFKEVPPPHHPPLPLAPILPLHTRDRAQTRQNRARGAR